MPPPVGVPGAHGAGHIDVNDAAKWSAVMDAQGAIGSFVKDPCGRVTSFAVPGAAVTYAAGVNDRGQVAGTYFDPGASGGSPPPRGTVHGFVRQPNGRITTIDLPGFDDTAVTDINDRGQVVGQTLNAAGQGIGFLRDPDGRVSIIDLPGRAEVGELLALNDRGDIVVPDLGTGLDPSTST